MSEELKTALGVDFGGTSVKAAVIRGEEVIGEMERIHTQEFTNPDDLIDALVDKIGDIKKRHPEIEAVGVGVPGAIDFKKGMTYNLTNVPGWKSVPLRDILGTGVGGGLILNGKMYRGNQSAAGEIGQMSVDLHGVDGPYGNNGALERYIGNRQIGELARQMYFDHDGTKLSEADATPEALSARASQGDEIARKVWVRVAEYLGDVLSSIVYLLNPDAIVIGGGVAYAGKLIFEPLSKNLASSLSTEFFEALKVVPAKFGNTAGVIGCSAMALEELSTN